MYWKIFFSFWLVVILSLTIFLSIDFAYFQPASTIAETQEAEYDLQSFADKSAAVLENEGVLALTEWIELQTVVLRPHVLLVGPDRSRVLSVNQPGRFFGTFAARQTKDQLVANNI